MWVKVSKGAGQNNPDKQEKLVSQPPFASFRLWTWHHYLWNHKLWGAEPLREIKAADVLYFAGHAHGPRLGTNCWVLSRVHEGNSGILMYFVACACCCPHDTTDIYSLFHCSDKTFSDGSTGRMLRLLRLLFFIDQDLDLSIIWPIHSFWYE